MNKFVLVPGYVRSKNDGDLHFINAEKLARLYGISMRNCRTSANEFDQLTSAASGDILLYPDSTGEYRLPEVPWWESW